MKSFFFSKKGVVPVAVTLELSACATAKPTHLPDGSQGYSISRDGAEVGINGCEKVTDLFSVGLCSPQHEINKSVTFSGGAEDAAQ